MGRLDYKMSAGPTLRTGRKEAQVMKSVATKNITGGINQGLGSTEQSLDQIDEEIMQVKREFIENDKRTNNRKQREQLHAKLREIKGDTILVAKTLPKKAAREVKDHSFGNEYT